MMSLLAIDRGKKRFGVAYASSTHGVVLPIGSVDNTPDVMYSLAHILAERNVKKVLVGYPSQRSTVQEAIDKFVMQLTLFLPPECTIEKINEDYTSVQAGEILGSYKKTAGEDTLAAIQLIERYRSKT